MPNDQTKLGQITKQILIYPFIYGNERAAKNLENPLKTPLKLTQNSKLNIAHGQSQCLINSFTSSYNCFKYSIEISTSGSNMKLFMCIFSEVSINTLFISRH